MDQVIEPSMALYYYYYYLYAVDDIAGSVLSTACGTTLPTATIETSDSTAYVRYVTNSAANDIRFQLNFSSSVEGSPDCSLFSASLSVCLSVSVSVCVAL